LPGGDDQGQRLLLNPGERLDGVLLGISEQEDIGQEVGDAPGFARRARQAGRESFIACLGPGGGQGAVASLRG
jgi:hypothetical protein